MRQIEPLLEILKKTLKSKGVTYKEIALGLNLSEASIKRHFSSGDLTLNRLEEICQLVDLNFLELCKQAGERESSDEWYLSFEQEKTFSEKPRLFYFYVLLRGEKTLSAILKNYELEATEAERFLLILDKMKLIELYTANKFKIKKTGLLRLRRDGPIGRTLFERTKKEFLQDDFLGDQKFLRFSLMGIHQSQVRKFQIRMDKMIQELQEESKFFSDNDPQLNETGILIALRPWHYDQIEAIKKRKA